jgi:hypothetical protein
MPIALHSSIQIVLSNVSALPKDAVTNTLHFQRAAGMTHAAFCTATFTPLNNFLNVAATPATRAPAWWINDQMSRGVGNVRFKAYDLSVAPPHVPVETTTTLGVTGDATSLPNEFALCLSFKGDVVPGVPLGRQRGRIYVGPLNLAAIAGAEAAGDQRPTTGTGGIIDSLRYGFVKLATDLWANGIKICVYSPTGNLLTPVTSCWVDNSFDTQRSRGAAATSRTSNNVTYP